MRILTTAQWILIHTFISGGVSRAQPHQHDFSNVFSHDGQLNILDETHYGIANGHMTIGIPYKHFADMDGLWAPPYVSSDFRLAVRIMDQDTPTTQYKWWPHKVQRNGLIKDIKLNSVTSLIHGRRAGIMSLTLENTASNSCEVPIQFSVKGSLDRRENWEFGAPTSASRLTFTAKDNRLIAQQGDSAIILQCLPTPDIRWDPGSSGGKRTVLLPPKKPDTIYLVFSMGSLSEATTTADFLAKEPGLRMQESNCDYLSRVHTLFEKLPWFESNNPLLAKLYQRSLVHLIMNRWDITEFALRPYYSTGSVKGGCVCNYLWNFGENWEIFPLYDPQAARTHIKQFLSIDLTTHFAFNPMTGQGFGPWYMVNQEKIIGMVYYYVKNTGDRTFLQEEVNGKTILEHVLLHATIKDNPAHPGSLTDYGPSNSHLELRRGYAYNHVMPDLNGRRYANYMMAAQLSDLADKPAKILRDHAEALKHTLKKELWNPEARWFDFRNGQGLKETRYTIQIFKLFGSSVLDAEEEAGLLSHWNEKEFLGKFGLHSMSKTDIAYDAVDIDNGGGGSCTCFPPQIAERLYKSKHVDLANDLIHRILWWGERLPYWGDSLVADQIQYRKDTPLQCTIDGASVAQCIIFGMFGIDAQFDGSIVICPHPPAFASEIALKGLKIRGTVVDICVSNEQFRVKTATSEALATVGETVVIKKDGKFMGNKK